MIEPIRRPNLKAAPWLELANNIRARGHVINPFRLGMEAGRADLNEPCPYNLPQSASLYQDGVTAGRRFARQLALNAKLTRGAK